jgi:hypothetical protein
MQPQPLHVKNAPSPKLVFAYLLSGLASFVFLSAWTLLHYGEWEGFFASTHFLAWVHVAVLGWINLTIFGVLFQFIPVVLNTRLGSEKLAWWQLGFYLPGAAGMVACFWWGRLDWPLHSFASVLWVGFALFAWNMLLTYREVKVWTWTARYIYAAVLYLLVTIMLGLFLSIHLVYPMIDISHLTLLKIHAQAGFVGWILFIVVGVALKLLPMFLLAHNFTLKPAAWGFWLMNAGLITWSLATVTERFGGVANAGLLLLVAGISACLLQVVAIFRKRNRVRSTPSRQQEVRLMEIPLRFAAGGFGALGLAVLAGLAAAWGKEILTPAVHNQVVTVYGALVLLGGASLLIQSFLYKIIPFLIWLHKLGPMVGKARVPNIRDLLPETSCARQLALYCLGAAGAVVAVGFELKVVAALSAAGILFSSLWLVANLFVVWKRAIPLGPLANFPSCEPPGQGGTAAPGLTQARGGMG